MISIIPGSIMVTEERACLKSGLLPVVIFLAAFMLFYPGVTSFMAPDFDIRLFSAGTLSLLALGLLLFDSRRILSFFASAPKIFLVPFLVILLLSMLHFISKDSYSFADFGVSTAIIFIPLFACIYHEKIEKLFPKLMCLLWLLNAAYIVIQLSENAIFLGICGNKNWNAALIVMTTPFAVRKLISFISARMKLPRYFAVSAGVLLAVLSFGAFVKCGSRGGMLALLAVLFLFACMHIPDRFRRRFILSCIGALTAGIVLFVLFGTDLAAKIIANDERLILWEGTASMIASNPVSGVGKASFENEFIRYKPLEYFFTTFVAVRVNHPHNDLFFTAACYGLAGLAAWLMLLYYPVFLLFRKYRELDSTEFRIILFVTVYAAAHSLLDLILFEWPTSIITLVMLGLIWNRTYKFAPTDSAQSFVEFRFASPFMKISGLLIIVFSLASAVILSYCTASVHILKKAGLPPAAATRTIDSVMRTNPGDPAVLYDMMLYAMNKLENPSLALAVSKQFDLTPYPDYTHVHAMRAGCYSITGDYGNALDELRRERLCYPVQVLPLVNMVFIAEKSRRTYLVKPLYAELQSIMEMRRITPQMLDAIIKRPAYDLRPWALGKPGIPDDYVPSNY